MTCKPRARVTNEHRLTSHKVSEELHAGNQKVHRFSISLLRTGDVRIARPLDTISGRGQLIPRHLAVIPARIRTNTHTHSHTCTLTNRERTLRERQGKTILMAVPSMPASTLRQELGIFICQKQFVWL